MTTPSSIVVTCTVLRQYPVDCVAVYADMCAFDTTYVLSNKQKAQVMASRSKWSAIGLTKPDKLTNTMTCLHTSKGHYRRVGPERQIGRCSTASIQRCPAFSTFTLNSQYVCPASVLFRFWFPLGISRDTVLLELSSVSFRCNSPFFFADTCFVVGVQYRAEDRACAMPCRSTIQRRMRSSRSHGLHLQRAVWQRLCRRYSWCGS